VIVRLTGHAEVAQRSDPPPGGIRINGAISTPLRYSLLRRKPMLLTPTDMLTINRGRGLRQGEHRDDFRRRKKVLVASASAARQP
jgi:hypothetical protein